MCLVFAVYVFYVNLTVVIRIFAFQIYKMIKCCIKRFYKQLHTYTQVMYQQDKISNSKNYIKSFVRLKLKIMSFTWKFHVFDVVLIFCIFGTLILNIIIYVKRCCSKSPSLCYIIRWLDLVKQQNLLLKKHNTLHTKYKHVYIRIKNKNISLIVYIPKITRVQQGTAFSTVL